MNAYKTLISLVKLRNAVLVDEKPPVMRWIVNQMEKNIKIKVLDPIEDLMLDPMSDWR